MKAKRVQENLVEDGDRRLESTSLECKFVSYLSLERWRFSRVCHRGSSCLALPANSSRHTGLYMRWSRLSTASFLSLHR